MVLFPLTDEDRQQSAQRIPAWQAVEKKQKQSAKEWWLIAQPDHAALAGDLAANLQSPDFPQLDANLIRAIALHDAGWAQFDGGERGTGNDLHVALRDPKLAASGRPLSFLEMTPTEFLVAWTDSIAHAEQAAALGGAMVSQHFCRLAEYRLHSQLDDQQDTLRLRQFLADQSAYQQQMLHHDHCSSGQLHLLTDVLQFCDLLSLYLCCGAQDPIEFPWKFNGRVIRLEREKEMYQLEPRIFGSGISLGVTARRYPLSGAVEVGILPFLLS